MNIRDKLITCYQKAGSSLVQMNTTISSLLLKKKDGTLRMCIDYCSINNSTVVNQYPLPRKDGIRDYLGGFMVYSKLDLATGYHQLAIKPITPTELFFKVSRDSINILFSPLASEMHLTCFRGS